ncbi:hypothetical protein [Clostridium sp. HBUAS56017]|nr:hypothetical protein [Clostridium sp. HBUAS56017]
MNRYIISYCIVNRFTKNQLSKKAYANQFGGIYMEDSWIEPKMIDFGNNEMNKAEETINKECDEIYKEDNNATRKQKRK